MPINQLQEIAIQSAADLLERIKDYEPGIVEESEEAGEVLELFKEHFPWIIQNETDPEIGDGMSDVEADADTLRSVGWGTDEDYGADTEYL